MKTVSLELAKQLKEAGYPQDTYLHWKKYRLNGELQWKLINEYPDDMYPASAIFASPTADEILDQLPKEIIGDEGMRFDLNIYLGEGNQWVVCYWWDEDSRRSSGMFIKNIPDLIFADACAKMWLYLKKEALL